MLSCEYCENFKNNLFYRTPPVVAAFGYSYYQSKIFREITAYQKDGTQDSERTQEPGPYVDPGPYDNRGP